MISHRHLSRIDSEMLKRRSGGQELGELVSTVGQHCTQHVREYFVFLPYILTLDPQPHPSLLK